MAGKIHYILVTAFAKPEDAVKLKSLLAKTVPEGAEISEKSFEPESEGGVFTDELVGYTAKITGSKAIREFHTKLMSEMDEYDKKKLLEEVASRVDDECNLYLRLSKNEAAQGCMVFESKDCIHVRYKLACYPAKKQTAVELAQSLIKDGLH